MIKKYSLVFVAFLCFVLSGFGQIVGWDFNGENTANPTSIAEIFDTNLNISPTLTRGSGAAASAAGNSFRTTGFQNNGISTANSDYFQFILRPDAGYLLSLSTIDGWLAGTSAFSVSPGVSSQFAYSLDGTNFTLIGSPQINIGNGVLAQINLTGIAALQNINASTTVTFRYYASGQTTTGGWGFISSSLGIYGLAIGGTVTTTTPTPTITLTPTTLTGFNYIQGAGPSGEQSFSVSGTNLMSDIVLTTPANYQISTTSGSGFGTTLNLAPTAGTVNATPIYVRLVADLTQNTYSGNVSATSTSATTRNVAVSGTVTNLIDYCNIQFPTTTQTIVQGATTNVVYAQVYEPGVTDTPFSQGAGITAWIGYSATNPNPNTASWTWLPATYNNIGGNNDEYFRELGSTLLPGIYYYASRFQLNTGAFAYGGIGGVWNNDSVQLNVEADQVNFCNVDFPKLGNILVGGTHTVYAQVYEPGVTDAVGKGANILAWIGYNTANVNPYSDTGWTWVPATYGSDESNDMGNPIANDQYVATFGAALPAGTYYYASRFQLNGSSFSYGGIQSDNVGNFWDATTNNNGILTITNPPCNDLMISEYVEGSSNNKYIEIYNPTSSSINLSGYRLATYFNGNITFSSLNLSGTLNPYSTFTIENSSESLNVSSNLSTNNIVMTFNGNDVVALQTSTGINIDVVGSIGSSANFAADTTLRRKSTLQNSNTIYSVAEWDVLPINDVSDLGNHTSDCQAPTPELQLADNTATNQNCGYTISFSSHALNTNTDITFTIKNVGSADLIVSSIGITGDYTILSPSTPFTVTAGNNQVVTVRFTPTLNGTRTGVVTINNNDSNEGMCTVNLTGVGFTPAPEINVEGNLGSFPDITNGDMTPSGTDNTLFAAQFIGSSQSKSYRINNEGTADLTVLGVTIGGVNPSDFTVTITPATTIAPSTFSLLEITFSPLAAGIRTAVVSIANNDSNENPTTFMVQGTGNCVASTTTLLPSSGPVGTIITVTGTNYAISTTAQISGIAASVTYISPTVIEVAVPDGALTGNLVILNSLGCSSSNAFTVIDNKIAGCDGNSNLSDLFISEVTDATVGGVSYIEIYNGTGNAVPLGDYSLGIYSNGSIDPSNVLTLNDIFLENKATYIVAIGVTGSPSSTNTCSITGGNGQLANQTSGIGGINKKDNEHDMIRLLKSNGTVVVDEFGVYQDENWMDTTVVTGDRGFNFIRLNTAVLLPNPIFNISDWNVIDWIGSGSGSCGTNDYSNIGIYDFSRGAPPTVTLQPIAPLSNCDLSAILSVAGTEGYNGNGDTQELTYQWFYNAPNTNTWVEISPTDTTYNGQQSEELSILNTLNLDNYQYYAQIRESGVSCFKASNAIRLKVQKTTWDGNSWSPMAPDINTIVIIEGDYDTGVQTSFSTCNLLVSSGELIIADNTYVQVENNLTVDGKIIVSPQGSFVQVNNSGLVNGSVLTDKTKITVNKETSRMDNWYEYTYWSSPVANETIGSALTDASTNMRFRFSAPDFRDSYSENGNTNTFEEDEQDDIDDDPNYINDGTISDWQPVFDGDVMLPGVGYASTHKASLFAELGCSNNSSGNGCKFIYSFRGPFNNGIIQVPVYRNDEERDDNNWNFIGNPYASAISATAFLNYNTDISTATNRVIDGAIYLWSQHTAPNSTASGNQNLNFSNDDYAIINGVGDVSTSNPNRNGSDPTNRMIPSGQGFFVSMSDATDIGTTFYSHPSGSAGDIQTKNVIFNNSMRVIGANDNSQFFRTGSSGITANKLKINLSSDNGVFSQIFVGYMEGATDAYDGMYYDAPRNQSNSTFSSLYTFIPNSDKKFAIQAKNPNRLTLDEMIPLGFHTSISQATLYRLSVAQFEGDFFSNQSIFLKDNLLNVFHNLSASDYNFTSQTGEYNNRFEIVFRDQALWVIENEITASALNIYELPSGHIKFSVGNGLTIQAVTIVDMLGRTLYQLQGDNASEVYNLSNLSQSAYVAKVTLSNGQIITKRAVKRQ